MLTLRRSASAIKGAPIHPIASISVEYTFDEGRGERGEGRESRSLMKMVATAASSARSKTANVGAPWTSAIQRNESATNTAIATTKIQRRVSPVMARKSEHAIEKAIISSTKKGIGCV